MSCVRIELIFTWYLRANTWFVARSNPKLTKSFRLYFCMIMINGVPLLVDGWSECQSNGHLIIFGSHLLMSILLLKKKKFLCNASSNYICDGNWSNNLDEVTLICGLFSLHLWELVVYKPLTFMPKRQQFKHSSLFLNFLVSNERGKCSNVIKMLWLKSKNWTVTKWELR